jgi:hypothetical protein
MEPTLNQKVYEAQFCEARFKNDGELTKTMKYLRLLESRGLIALGARPLFREDGWTAIRVVEGDIPRPVAQPKDALAAWTSYEKFHTRGLDAVGGFTRNELKAIVR